MKLVWSRTITLHWFVCSFKLEIHQAQWVIEDVVCIIQIALVEKVQLSLRAVAADYFGMEKSCLTHWVLVFPHIETSHLICCANQLTGFYMMDTLALNGLNPILMTPGQ